MSKSHSGNVFNPTRRAVVGAAGAAAVLAAIGAPRRGFAQEKLKVAAIYTVPVEQQWVQPHPQGANAAKERGDIDYVFSENVSNTDYERVMREYAEAGNKLIVGEVFGVEDAARAVAGLSRRRLPDGLVLQARRRGPNFSVFDNYIQDASYLTGIIAGAMTKSNNIGMVGGYPDPRGQPPDARLHGRREGDARRTPSSRSPSSAPGSIRPRPRKPPSRRSMPAPTCSTPSASASRTPPRRGRPGDRQRHRHAGRLSRHRRRLGAVALRADARQGDRRGQGRHLQGRRLRRLFLHEGRRLLARAARHLRGQGAGRGDGQGRREGEGDQGRLASPSRSTTTSRSRAERCLTFSPLTGRRWPEAAG